MRSFLKNFKNPTAGLIVMVLVATNLAPFPSIESPGIEPEASKETELSLILSVAPIRGIVNNNGARRFIS